MSVSTQTAATPSAKYIPVAILFIGAFCMVVAGYFLIEGLLQFGGNEAAKRMLIVAGVLFQVTESLCFVSAAALTSHSLRWRYAMFLLGIVLFGFSIAVMTFAQKAALETGEATAAAIDERRTDIRQQIASLDELIVSYRLNAEKQSQSIYANSRELGQDSINKATELAEKKMQLSMQLYALNESRRQTSSDFFNKLEQVTGLGAVQTEFWFLFLRSLLLELCGIMLMSFGAHLYAHNTALLLMATEATIRVKATKKKPVKRKSKPTAEKGAQRKASLIESTEPRVQKPVENVISLSDNVSVLRPNTYEGLKEDKDAGSAVGDIIAYADKVARLYESGKLKTLEKNAIRSALKKHHGIQIGSQKASQVSDIVKDYVEAL